MTVANSTIPLSTRKTIDLPYLSDRCFELQTIIYAAFDDTTTLATRMLLKAIKPILVLIDEWLPDLDESLAQRLERVDSVAELVIYADERAIDAFDLPSVEHALYVLLNDFRKAVGIPEVDMMTLEDLEEAQQKANKGRRPNACHEPSGVEVAA